jgi:hypothetical protein
LRRLVLALALALAALAPLRAEESLTRRFERGVAELRAGQSASAVETLGAVFAALQKQGRGADSGVVAHWLAQAMERSGHAQADEAHGYALEALAQVANSREFVESAEALMRRDGAGRGAAAAEKLVERAVRGMNEELREIAIAALVRHFKARGDEAANAAAMDRLATIEGEGELLIFLRGTRRALAADKAHREGRYVEARALAERSLADLRRADRPDTLALAVLTRARVDFADGAYARALPFAEEAETLLRGGERGLWIEALSMRARLLERLDRADEAVAAYEEAERRVAAAGPEDGVLALLRLDRAPALLRALRVDEARALLEAEKVRVRDVTMPQMRAAFYGAACRDRVAALLIAEKDFAGAREAAQDALARLEPLPALADGLRMEARRRLAAALVESDDAAATESALRAAIAASERLFHPAHPEVAFDLNAYALHLEGRDRLSEAQAALRRVADIVARGHGEASLKHGYALANLAQAAARGERYGEADATMARALAIAEAAGAPPQKRIEMMAVRAEMRRLAGDPRGALVTLDAAVRLARAQPEIPASVKIAVDGGAAASLFALGEIDEAERLAAEILALPTPATREDRANLNLTRLHAAEMAGLRGRLDEALALTRGGGEEIRRLGQAGAVVEHWATLTARHAWRAAQADAEADAQGETNPAP